MEFPKDPKRLICSCLQISPRHPESIGALEPAVECARAEACADKTVRIGM